MSLPVLGLVIDEFARWLMERGYSFMTVQGHLYRARHVDGSLYHAGVHALANLTHNHFEAADREFPLWARITIRHLERFLEETGRLAPRSCAPATLVAAEVDRYKEYMRTVRGLEQSTIHSHARYVERFLLHLRYDRDADVLACLSIKTVDDFLSDCAKTHNRYSLQHVVAYLRSFLKHCHERGVLVTPLHTMIDTPRIYRLEQLPRSLPWETVDALIRSIDRTSVLGMRDYALLYLIASYGLRSCEVTALTLDDINWREGVISLPQKKTRNRLALPLTDDVAEVLIAYLKKRPSLPYRELFLRVRAPQGALQPAGVGDIFERWVNKAGLDIPFHGAHCIRHSYAVHLLRQGTSVKAIGDLLGHRDAESTCIYLRLAVEDLRLVALPVPVETSEIVTRTRCPLIGYKRVVSPPLRSPLGSPLAAEIEDYLRLKRSLGRRYNGEEMILRSLDAFLVAHMCDDLTGEIWGQWCTTLGHLTPTVRRNHMRVTRNFCLYQRRSRPEFFLPDPRTFPSNHQPVAPYIVSEAEMALLLKAAMNLPRRRSCLFRPETLRIALLLLFTTGLRRGELLRLTLDDVDLREETITIRETKFHKSRVIPLSSSVAGELKAYLELRERNRLFLSPGSPVVISGHQTTRGKGYTGNGLRRNWVELCTFLNILTPRGRPPRLHDIRHSFAVNILLRWYRNNDDVQAKLPLLATYMGHVSVVSTYHYLTFVNELRSEASELFRRSFSEVVKTHGGAQ
jgi:integrase/recombinase XerD